MSKTRRNRILLGQGIIVGITAVLWFVAHNPAVAVSVRSSLGARFDFAKVALSAEDVTTDVNHVAVNPHMKHIATWMSSVGAAVSAFDMDGDGLSNDLCVADPRRRDVRVLPAPMTGPRYQPVIIVAPGVDYQAEKAFPTGCRIGDFNEDGLSDVLVVFFGRSPLLLMRQSAGASAKGTSPFKFVRRQLLPQDEEWYTATATLADVDGDGHSDIVIGNYFREGDDIYDRHSKRRPELHRSLSNAKNGGVNRLYLWSGLAQDRAVFKEVRPFTELQSRRWTLAIGAADLNRDGLVELYFANDFGPDTLFLNRSTPGNVQLQEVRGRKGFTIPKSKVLGNDSFKGMGIDFADINDDGHFDMFVSNIAGEWQLEESHFVWVSTGALQDFDQGVAPYLDRSESLGMAHSSWGWDTKFADFDNDGQQEALQATGFIAGKINRWPEMHQWATGNDGVIHDPAFWPYMMDGDISGRSRNPFYVKGANGRYVDMADDLGVDERAVSRGFTIADTDGDGDLDFAVANQWQNFSYFQNNTGTGNASVVLRILNPTETAARKTLTVTPGYGDTKGIGSSAVGTFVSVKMPDGRVNVGQVDGGNGHSGARSAEVHIGLGKVPADTAVPVTLSWRNRQGLQKAELTVKPGWHTVVLPRNN